LKTALLWTLLYISALLLFNAPITTPSVYAQDAVYNPGSVGAPTRRSGAGTRSIGKLPALNVLTPEHTGLVINPQPTLYWSIDKAPNSPVVFSLRPSPLFAPPNTKPFVQKEITVETVGIHAVPLGDSDYKLDPEVEYEWSVMLTAHPNVIASGTIMRLPPTAQVLNKINQTAQQQPMALPIVYAQHGYWYDAIATLSALIDQYPKNDVLRANRIALLEQVKLPKVAQFDKILLSANPSPDSAPTPNVLEPTVPPTRGIKMEMVKDKTTDSTQVDATTAAAPPTPIKLQMLQQAEGDKAAKPESATAVAVPVTESQPAPSTSGGIKMEMLQKNATE